MKKQRKCSTAFLLLLAVQWTAAKWLPVAELREALQRAEAQHGAHGPGLHGHFSPTARRRLQQAASQTNSPLEATFIRPVFPIGSTFRLDTCYDDSVTGCNSAAEAYTVAQIYCLHSGYLRPNGFKVEGAYRGMTNSVGANRDGGVNWWELTDNAHNTFLYITCDSRTPDGSPGVSTFASPHIQYVDPVTGASEDLPLDYCYDEQGSCGRSTADAYCRYMGYSLSVDARLKSGTLTTVLLRTVSFSTGGVIKRMAGQTFAFITCAGTPVPGTLKEEDLARVAVTLQLNVSSTSVTATRRSALAAAASQQMELAAGGEEASSIGAARQLLALTATQQSFLTDVALSFAQASSLGLTSPASLILDAATVGTDSSGRTAFNLLVLLPSNVPDVLQAYAFLDAFTNRVATVLSGVGVSADDLATKWAINTGTSSFGVRAVSLPTVVGSRTVPTGPINITRADLPRYTPPPSPRQTPPFNIPPPSPLLSPSPRAPFAPGLPSSGELSNSPPTALQSIDRLVVVPSSFDKFWTDNSYRNTIVIGSVVGGCTLLAAVLCCWYMRRCSRSTAYGRSSYLVNREGGVKEPGSPGRRNSDDGESTVPTDTPLAQRLQVSPSGRFKGRAASAGGSVELGAHAWGDPESGRLGGGSVDGRDGPSSSSDRERQHTNGGEALNGTSSGAVITNGGNRLSGRGNNPGSIRLSGAGRASGPITSSNALNVISENRGPSVLGPNPLFEPDDSPFVKPEDGISTGPTSRPAAHMVTAESAAPQVGNYRVIAAAEASLDPRPSMRRGGPGTSGNKEVAPVDFAEQAAAGEREVGRGVSSTGAASLEKKTSFRLSGSGAAGRAPTPPFTSFTRSASMGIGTGSMRHSEAGSSSVPDTPSVPAAFSSGRVSMSGVPPPPHTAALATFASNHSTAGSLSSRVGNSLPGVSVAPRAFGRLPSLSGKGIASGNSILDGGDRPSAPVGMPRARSMAGAAFTASGRLGAQSSQAESSIREHEAWAGPSVSPSDGISGVGSVNREASRLDSSDDEGGVLMESSVRSVGKAAVSSGGPPPAATLSNSWMEDAEEGDVRTSRGNLRPSSPGMLRPASPGLRGRTASIGGAAAAGLGALPVRGLQRSILGGSGRPSTAGDVFKPVPRASELGDGVLTQPVNVATGPAAGPSLPTSLSTRFTQKWASLQRDGDQ